jgi:hypothetical protein
MGIYFLEVTLSATMYSLLDFSDPKVATIITGSVIMNKFGMYSTANSKTLKMLSF